MKIKQQHKLTNLFLNFSSDNAIIINIKKIANDACSHLCSRRIVIIAGVIDAMKRIINDINKNKLVSEYFLFDKPLIRNNINKIEMIAAIANANIL